MTSPPCGERLTLEYLPRCPEWVVAGSEEKSFRIVLVKT